MMPPAEKLWQTLFQRTPQGMAVLDRHGVVVAANAAFQQLLAGHAGGARPALVGLWHQVAVTLAGGQAVQMDHLLAAGDRHRVARVTMIPVAGDDGGEPQALLATFQDVTAEAYQQEQLQQQVEEIDALRDVLIETLAMFAEWRDPGIMGHLRRVRAYTRILLDELAAQGMPGAGDPEHRHHVARSAVLHDVGKIAVPEGILFKPARLTPEEYSVVRMHTVVGARLLEEAGRALAERVGQGSNFLGLAAEIARWHHERWDGYGYPDGLRGAETPLHARVVGLVDVYDALTTRRVYKEALSHADAVEEIRAGRGTQFDPDLVDAFIAAEARFAAAQRELAAAGEG